MPVQLAQGPGSISTSDGAMVFAASKLEESAMRTVPYLVRTGSCARRRKLKPSGTVPATRSESIGPGTGSGNM